MVFGIALASSAEAKGTACGGVLDPVKCSATEWCDYPPEHACGVADHQGECMARPDVCTEEVRWVCGCDNTSYSNECKARIEGTDVAHVGKCDRKP
jgi:hypothetical protein